LSDIWGILESQSYPFLLWQKEPGSHNYPEEIPDFYYLTLMANPPIAGKVEGTGSFIFGQIVDICAVPNPGYRFVNWTGNTTYADHPDHESCKVTMPAENIIMIANFEEFVGIEELQADGIKVYPNPVKQKLFIEWDNALGDHIQVRLINVLGKETLKRDIDIQGEALINLDVLGLNTGLYILSIQSDAGIYTKKIIIGN
jgi:hypothetical protein